VNASHCRAGYRSVTCIFLPIDMVRRRRVPIFEEVEPMVRAEWISAQRAEATRKIYAAMRERYEVLLPAPGVIADAEPGHDLP
jgi:hypothetical protein